MENRVLIITTAHHVFAGDDMESEPKFAVRAVFPDTSAGVKKFREALVEMENREESAPHRSVQSLVFEEVVGLMWNMTTQTVERVAGISSDGTVYFKNSEYDLTDYLSTGFYG